MGNGSVAGLRAGLSRIVSPDVRWVLPVARGMVALLSGLSLLETGELPIGLLVAGSYVVLTVIVACVGSEAVRNSAIWFAADIALVAVTAVSASPALIMLLPVPLACVYGVTRGPVAGVLAAVLMGGVLGAPVLLGYPVPELRAWGAAILALSVAAASVGAAAAAERRARRHAEDLAITDDLTGLYNQRYFYERGREELARARRYMAPLALLMIDVDQFKTVNDRLGHLVGDGALRRVADAMRGSLRVTDLMFRYGGEEFAVILPETGGAAALQAAERIRSAVENLGLDGPEGESLPLSVSIGVAEWQGEVDMADLLAKADGALSDAKEGGRNRVEVSWFGVSRTADALQSVESSVDRGRGPR